MKTRFVSVLLTIILLAACFTLPRLKIFAESIKTGTLVTFGQYPQSEVKDKVTLNALNDLNPNGNLMDILSAANRRIL